MEPNNGDKRLKNHCLPPPQHYPWLLYFNGKGKDNQTFCSISDPTKTYSRSIPEFEAASLWTIQHGWCLLANKIRKTTKLFLWNPINLKKINLPPLKHKGICEIILSSSPTADEVCSIFLFSALATSTSIFYCQLGDKQWTEVDYREDLVNELKANRFHLKNPVYCNGCLYAESWFGNFLVKIEKLQPGGLKINSACVSMPKISQKTSFESSCTLLESNNPLFQIEILHAQHKVIAVVVHRLDFSRMLWEKVESIEDRVFFISNVDLSFSCKAINPETERGRIYFTLKDFVYIYDIENNSLSISRPLNNCSSSWWFMTDLRMIGSPKEERGQTQIKSVDVYSKEMEDDSATNAHTLPLEMFEEITKRLNVQDYLHFRATCRLFCVAAPPIQWRSISSSMSTSRLSLSPLFVSFEKGNVLTMTHPKHGLNYKYSINLPEDIPANCDICYSKDGWLLMTVNTFSNLFFNPFTREVKQLAFGPRTIRNTQCVSFSHPPTSSECVVVEFNKMEKSPPAMMVSITSLGEEEWSIGQFEDTNFPLYNISPTYYKGEFYYISEEEGNLGVLKVEERDARWNEVKLYAPCTDYYNRFLVECDGSLLSVFEGAFGKWVRVFKLSETKKTWVEVESLGNHMLFVGNTSFSAVASIPGMENKIYFPKFFDEDIVFYSLETNKYHTFKNEVVNFQRVSERLNGSWIEARWN